MIANSTRQERHYGFVHPVLRPWWKRNLRYIVFVFSGLAAILCFFTVMIITIHLLPGAIEAEIDRQKDVVSQVMGERQ